MKFSVIILYLILIPAVVYSQVPITSTTMPLKTDNGFSIGIFGGPNASWVQSYWNTSSQVGNLVNCASGIGSDYSLAARFKFKEGFFLSTGISYEIQAYKINATDFSNLVPQLYFNINSLPQYWNTEYMFNAYYASIPLMTGYAVSRKKWEFSAGLGMEFYCNFENKVTVNNVFPGEAQAVGYFYDGHILSLSSGIYNHYYWGMFGTFGVIQAGVSHKISRRLSISCMPVFRFTDPFAEKPWYESFVHNVRQEDFSFKGGLIYNFPNRYLAEDFKGENEKWDKFSIGFSVIPTYLTNKIAIPSGSYWPPKTNLRFSFSYAFTAQYNLGERIKIESGIAIDNFNYLSGATNTLIGLPIVIKYYFPLDKDQHNSLYLGAGCHLDYPTNIGWLYDPAHPYILPIAIMKAGYQLNFGENYYLDANLGYEHSFPNIQTSIGNFLLAGDAQIVNLPNYFYSTIGLGYKF